MDILISLIIVFIFLAYNSFHKVEKEDLNIYQKTVEDTSFNTARNRKP